MSILATGVIWLVRLQRLRCKTSGVRSIAVKMEQQANVSISIYDSDSGCEVLSVTSTIGSSMLLDSVSLCGA